MIDEDYRPWIRVGIKLNTGAGTPEDVLGILNILYGAKAPVIMHECEPNDVIFTLFALPKAPLKTLVNIIRHAAAVGTACHVIRAHSLPAFRFDASLFTESHLAEFIEENL